MSPREGGAVSSPEEEMTCEKQKIDESSGRKSGNTRLIEPVGPSESEQGRQGAGG